MNYEQKIYSVDRVAHILGVCKRTVQNYIRRGLLTCKREGKKMWITGADITAFIQNRKSN